MSLMHVLMQAAAAAAPVAEAQQGVTSYGPEFFAAQQPSTAVDMLNRIPGFTLENGAAVRGFEGAAGNVLIDGQRPASKTDTLQDILFRVPAGKVERIDIIRGGAPGIDMQGKTVLANVILKKDGGIRGVVAVADNRIEDGRDLGQVRIEGSGALRDIKWELSGRVARGLDDGMGAGKGFRFTPGQAPVRTGYDGEGDGIFYNLTGAVEGPLAGGTLRLNGRVNLDKFKGEELTRILTPPGGTEQNVFLQDTDDTELGFRFGRRFGEAWDMELVGIRQTRDRIVDNIFTDTSASRFFADRDTVETIGRGVLKYRASATLSLEAGGEVAVNTLDSRTRITVDGVVQAVPAANVEVEEDRKEAFVKATWRPSPQWTLDAGLRYETSTISSEGDVGLEKTLRYLKPRFAATWAPQEATQLRLRIEREVDQLNFNDFVASGGLNSAGGVTAGNPDLNPAQDWVIEAAVEQRFWTSGSVVLTYRHYEYSDVVDRGPVIASDGSIFDRPTNIGDGTRDVLQVDLTLPLDAVRLKGAQIKGQVLKRWAKVTDPTTGETRFPSGPHRLDWNASFSWDMPQYKITWGVDAFGGFRESYYRFNLIEEFKLNTYVRPYIEWKPRPDLNIRAELPNVTRRNLHDIFYIYPGRRTAGAAPSFIDDKNTNITAGGYFLRVRKTFG
jgi:outer membrane receptor protein involved in Fe transport